MGGANAPCAPPLVTVLHIVPPLRQPFYSFIDPASPALALILPEVNQVTGNCFRMVRIVLKITFSGLRYPKGVTGSVPLCPIMALANEDLYIRKMAEKRTYTFYRAVDLQFTSLK